MDAKAMTLRLPADKAAELARADSKPTSDALREAIDLLIEHPRRDKAFRDRLRLVIDGDRAILDRLAR